MKEFTTTTLAQLEDWANDICQKYNEAEAAIRISVAFKYINERSEGYGQENNNR